MRIYSLLDRKMLEYGALMQAQNDDVMKRLLRDTLPKSALPAQHPEDFDLVLLGSMSLETGVIAAGSPQLVAPLVDVLFPAEVSDGSR